MAMIRENRHSKSKKELVQKSMEFCKIHGPLRAGAFFAKNSAISLPHKIVLEITQKCNLNCTMCPRNQGVFDLTEGDHLSVDNFRHVIEQYPKLKYVTLVGTGEPFMNPYIFEMLDMAKSQGIYIEITTNGTLLDEETVRMLPDNVKKIFASIDNPIPEKYEIIRQGAKFDDVVSNLKRLKELRPDIELIIQSVIMKDSINDLPKLVDLAAHIGADQISLIHAFTLDQESHDKTHIRREDVASAEKSLQEVERLADEYGIGIDSRHFTPGKKNCQDPWLAPYITIDGDVYACSFVYQNRDNTGDSKHLTYNQYYLDNCCKVPQHQYRMGNLFEQPVSEIWNDARYKLLRTTIRNSSKYEEISSDEYDQMRNDANLDDDFSYCKICLWRWGLC